TLNPEVESVTNVGKIKRRLEDIKNQWAAALGLDLSHSESARLATDALLDSGAEAYHNVLTEEGEVDFLSPLEIQYIIRNSKDGQQLEETNKEEAQKQLEVTDLSSNLSATYLPMVSESHGPMLEQGWPMSDKRYYLKGPSNINVFFQTEKSHNIKDIIRLYISQATEVNLIAIVMDIFTDVDIFCDILEAANKRGVIVYLLLDQSSVKYFSEMCKKLKIDNSHLKNVGVRKVSGDIYCAKSGKKFLGQIHEKFIIIDCVHVFAGSYSFTWLSDQVHRNFVTIFSGHIVELFDTEFRRLYAQSKPVSEFSSTTQTVPFPVLNNLAVPVVNSNVKWPESHNTQSDAFSSLSSCSEPTRGFPSTLFSSGKGDGHPSPRQNGTPERRVYIPCQKQRHYSLLDMDPPRSVPAERYFQEPPRTAMNFKEVNVLTTQRGKPHNTSQMSPIARNYFLTDGKQYISQKPVIKPKHSVELFKLNKLTNPKYIYSTYENVAMHLKY
uniref:Scaffolding anchor of CK1 domain-containing protein n=1 Tax=Callorhinchus milii TaxID=7868 RepID=A0A4W3HP04_CALMI